MSQNRKYEMNTMNKREMLTKTDPSPDGFDYAAARRYLQKKNRRRRKPGG
jgi:hypothetical protein